jgi:hypothetical protein
MKQTFNIHMKKMHTKRHVEADNKDLFDEVCCEWCISILLDLDHYPLTQFSLGLTAHGHFSPNIPGCFISEDMVAYRKGNIVALGSDVHQKVVMEGVMEVGRYFIVYEVMEVGSIPIGHVWTTQLVTPLKLHLSVLLPMLLPILSHLWEAWWGVKGGESISKPV